jgi:hypothetical protein
MPQSRAGVKMHFKLDTTQGSITSELPTNRSKQFEATIPNRVRETVCSHWCVVNNSSTAIMVRGKHANPQKILEILGTF